MTIREARVLDCDRYTSSNGVEKQLMSVSEDNIRKINEKLLKLLHNKKKKIKNLHAISLSYEILPVQVQMDVVKF